MEALRDEVQDTWVSSQTTRDAVDALRAALGTCGSCRHYNDAEAVEMGWGHCAAPVGHPAPFRHKLMPLDERCKGWSAHDARP